MKHLHLFFKLLKVAFMSQMQYKASFLMLAASHFISTFVDVFGIWILFDRFKMVKGWTFPELAIIYGVMHMGFSTAEALGRGFDKFNLLVKSGDFDRLLLRPISTLMQVATRDVQLMRIGRFFQGALVLLWGCGQMKITLLSVSTAVIFISYIGTVSLFYGLLVLQATLCFWTTETIELMNITTYGGLQSGQYPLSIYNRYFRYFFTFAIPLGCVAFYPVATILAHETLPLWLGGFIAPLAGIGFMAIACLAWRFGVRRYHSAGC